VKKRRLTNVMSEGREKRREEGREIKR